MARITARQNVRDTLETEAAALAGVSEILGDLISSGCESAASLGVVQDRVDQANERLSELAVQISRRN